VLLDIENIGYVGKLLAIYEPVGKLVDYLTSTSLSVLSLSSGEHEELIFSSYAVCRYVWNLGKKCEDSIGISLLYRIQAEIYVISYPLPVTGHHLWFNITHPDTRQCLDQFSRAACHRKHRYSHWNFVVISNTSCYHVAYIQTVIYVIPYPLPVTGRHLWYITHPDGGKCSH